MGYTNVNNIQYTMITYTIIAAALWNGLPRYIIRCVPSIEHRNLYYICV